MRRVESREGGAPTARGQGAPPSTRLRAGFHTPLRMLVCGCLSGKVRSKGLGPSDALKRTLWKPGASSPRGGRTLLSACDVLVVQAAGSTGERPGPEDRLPGARDPGRGVEYGVGRVVVCDHPHARLWMFGGRRISSTKPPSTPAGREYRPIVDCLSTPG